MWAPLERYCPLISDAKGAPRSCPAGSIAEVGLRWCGATPRRAPENDAEEHQTFRFLAMMPRAVAVRVLNSQTLVVINSIC